MKERPYPSHESQPDALRAVLDGVTTTEAAAILRVSPRTVRAWLAPHTSSHARRMSPGTWVAVQSLLWLARK